MSGLDWEQIPAHRTQPKGHNLRIPTAEVCRLCNNGNLAFSVILVRLSPRDYWKEFNGKIINNDLAAFCFICTRNHWNFFRVTVF